MFTSSKGPNKASRYLKVVGIIVIAVLLGLTAVTYFAPKQSKSPVPCTGCGPLLKDRFTISYANLAVGGTSAQVWLYNPEYVALNVQSILIRDESGTGLYVGFRNSTATSSTTCGSQAFPSDGTGIWHTMPPFSPVEISLTLPPGCSGFGGIEYYVTVVDRYGTSVTYQVNNPS